MMNHRDGVSGSFFEPLTPSLNEEERHGNQARV